MGRQVRDVIGVKLNPFGSELFGVHLFDGSLQLTACLPMIRIRPESLHSGSLIISVSGRNYVLECTDCQKKINTQKDSLLFNLNWAMMVVQVRFGSSILESERDHFGRFIPQSLEIEGGYRDNDQLYTSSMVWAHWPGTILAIPTLNLVEPPKHWKALAVFEALNAALQFVGLKEVSLET